MVRDIKERGRTIDSVLRQYNTFVKPSYTQFIKPTMKYADIIIPYGRCNNIAIQLVVENIKTVITTKGTKLEEVSKITYCRQLDVLRPGKNEDDLYVSLRNLLSEKTDFIRKYISQRACRVWLTFFSKRLLEKALNENAVTKGKCKLAAVGSKYPQVFKGPDKKCTTVLFSYAILKSDTVTNIAYSCGVYPAA